MAVEMEVKNEALLDVLRKQEQQQAATDLLTPGFSPNIAFRPQSVDAQVGELRGEDQFQSLLADLEKAPSSIPKISPETREIYDKYSKFLKFYGATTGNYSGAKAFQSGITSSLDTGMIQDLLEDQREQRLSTGLHEILPFVTNESQLREAIKGLGMTMKEARRAQELWKDYRPDYRQDLDKMEAMKKLSVHGAEGYIRDMRSNMPSGMSQIDKRDWLNLHLKYISEGSDRTTVEEAIQRDFDWTGGGDYTPEDFWMPHKVNLEGIGADGRKRVRGAIDHLKLQGGYWEKGPQGEDNTTLRFNPTRIQNVNITDASNLRAMETLKRYGVVPINVNMEGSQIFRMTQDRMPVGAVIHSNNSYAMADPIGKTGTGY